jgi:hypothetical protein
MFGRAARWPEGDRKDLAVQVPNAHLMLARRRAVASKLLCLTDAMAAIPGWHGPIKSIGLSAAIIPAMFSPTEFSQGLWIGEFTRHDCWVYPHIKCGNCNQVRRA